MTREQRRDIFEAVGLLAIIASLLFLAMEIRQSNVQARAAAYQVIGISSSQWQSGVSDQVIRLLSESHYPEVLERWTLADWDRYERTQLSALRTMETILLQVEQGLLDADAMNTLGYTIEGNQDLITPAMQCIWPRVSGFIGTSLRNLIAQTLQADGFDCHIDIQSLRDETILGGVAD